VDAPVSVLNKPYKNGNNMNKKTILAASICAALSAPAWSLNILVANDDGCTSSGINTLMTELESRGHTVTMYAPASEQSGKAGSVETNAHVPDLAQFGVTALNSFLVSNNGFDEATSADNRLCVRVSNSDDPDESGDGSEITVSATPVDSVRVGITVMTDAGNKPDLVISGINDGQNIGISSTGSGTVGVAVTGLQEGIPSIAVSNFRDFSLYGLIGRGLAAPDLQDSSEFVADLVEQLVANQIDGQPLLPPFTGLNINIPSGIPKGIAHTQLGSTTSFSLQAVLGDDDNYHPTLMPLGLADLVGAGDIEAINALLDADTISISELATAGLDTKDESQMYSAGFITISVIDGDFTASLRKQELLKVKLREVAFAGTAAAEAAAESAE